MQIQTLQIGKQFELADIDPQYIYMIIFEHYYF